VLVEEGPTEVMRLVSLGVRFDKDAADPTGSRSAAKEDIRAADRPRQGPDRPCDRARAPGPGSGAPEDVVLENAIAID
jgi:hypothetical protein